MQESTKRVHGGSLARSRAGCVAMAIVVVGLACLVTGCGLVPSSRSPLARQLDRRLSEDVAKQVQRDPFPSASQVGL